MSMQAGSAADRPSDTSAHTISRTIVAEIATALAATTSLTELVTALRQHLKWLLPVTHVALYLLEDDGPNRRYRAVGAGDDETSHPIDDGLIGWALRHDTALDLPDLQDETRRPPDATLVGTEQREGSLLILPLRAHGALLGALTIGSTRTDAYSAVDHSLVNLVALQVAAAAHTALLIKRERRARALAEEAVRMRDQFLSTISHDLKNPLTTIKGRAQLLRHTLEGIEGPVGERAAAELTRIDHTASRMTRLINELLDVARLRAGQPLALDLHPGDLIELTRRIAAEYTDMGKRHRILVETAAATITGEFDLFRLERVLDNLISNAIKYSPTGGDITLRLREERAERDDAPGTSILEVEDYGLGVPAADLPHIFERFHRAGNVGGTAGTGLGLAGARQIVEQHGGTIAVDSREGVGTKVTVRLPLYTGQGRQAQRER